MRTRFAKFLGSLIAAVSCASAADIQSAVAKEAPYRVPRLPDGHPDFQGVWDHADMTPLERPPGFDSLVIDAKQAERLEAIINAGFEDRSTPTEPTEFFNVRSILPVRGTLRSSVIIDPADGKLPWTAAHRDWPKKTRDNVMNAMDGPEQRPSSERCLGNPASQPPMLYNPGTNLRQIIQTRDTVVIAAEFSHDARIVRLNAQHGPASIKQWLGDSIGWWEGDTLVIESTNFSPNDMGRMAMPNAFMVSANAKVTERFTRVADGELHYLFTVEDPDYYSQPWKGESHLMRKDERLFEYSCHEGNSSLVYILQGARVRDGQWDAIKERTRNQTSR